MNELEKLYSVLSREGYYTKSFDEFKTKYNEDDTYRDKVFSVVSRDGFFTKSKDEFFQKFAPIVEELKKKEDGESLSQEDTSAGDDLMGFYTKPYADSFKDFQKKTAEKYSDVIKKDRAFAAIVDNINSGLKRRYNRLVDSYLYNPSFDRNNPEAIAQANREIEEQFKEMRLQAFKENKDYNDLLDKYNSEIEEINREEYLARQKEEALGIAYAPKQTVLGPVVDDFFAKVNGLLAKGEGLLTAFGNGVKFADASFINNEISVESQKNDRKRRSLKELSELDPDQLVHLTNEGSYVVKTSEGMSLLPSSYGKAIPASEAVALLSEEVQLKDKELAPRIQDMLELKEFNNRLKTTKALTEDASFSNIMKNVAEQLPNMAVAMAMPVIGTSILESGNTYVEQLIDMARIEKGDDYTTQDVIDIIERGDDGAAAVEAAGMVSGSLDAIGMIGLGSVIAAPIRNFGKQVLKEAAKTGIKKITSSGAFQVGKGIVQSGFWEGVTEGLQGANMQYSRIGSVEETTGVRMEFDWKPVWEEALMGGVMGGIFGGVGTTLTVSTDTNTTGLPEDDITLAAVSQEKSYFNGGDAITRAEADTAIQQAENLDQLERIKVTNDEPLIAKFLEKQKELDDGKPSYTDDGRTINRKFAGKKIVLAQNVAEVERINIRNDEELQAEKEKKIEALKAKEAKQVAAPVEEATPEVPPEVLNLLTEKQREAYNKADEETKESIREVLLDESYERSIGVSDEPTPEWVSTEEQIEWEGEEELYRSGADFSTVIDNILRVTPEANEQVFVFGLAEYDIDKADSIIKNQDVELIDIPKDALPKLSYDFVLKTEEGIENADITNPVILARTDKGLLLIDGHHRVERALRDGKTVKAYVLTQEQARSTRLDLEEEAAPEVAPEVLTAEDKPVEEAKPVKTPEMEELENEIATLQSDIETYEIEAENTQEEIDIEKGNLKDAIADIDARIKEVRASKQSAAAKRDAIEELKAEKQDVKDDNSSLIEGYKEDIKNAKREAKKAANRIKRLSTKLEGLAPAEPVAEEKTYTMKDVSFEDDIKAIIKSGKPGKEVLNYTDTYKDEGQDYYVYENPESRLKVTIRKVAPRNFALDMDVMSSDTFFTPYASYYSEPVFGTRKRAEQAALEILRNPTLLYSGVGAVRTSLEPDLAKALIESRGIEPTKKVVGTLEVEEEEAVAAVSDIISKSKALAGQLNAGVITAEEYNTSIKELIDEYQNNIEIALEETPPIDTITADDSQSDIAAFEAQSPKLKFVKNLLNATKNFRGLFDAQDIPLKVHYFKSRKEMSKISAVLDGDESVAGGFMDAISNRIFIAEDALLEETAVHEFIHPIAKRIIRNNPELAARLEEEALAIPGIKEFIEQYEVDQQQEEAIVQSIAKAVLEALKKGRTIPQKIRDFFKKLLRVLGFNPEVVIGDSQSNLNDFIRNISEAFATGTPIKITKDLEQSELLEKIDSEKIKDIDKSISDVSVNRILLKEREELIDNIPILPISVLADKIVDPIAYDGLKTGDIEYKNPVTLLSAKIKGMQGGVLNPVLKKVHKHNIVASFTTFDKVLDKAIKVKKKSIEKFGIHIMTILDSMQGNRVLRDFEFGKGGIVETTILPNFSYIEFRNDLAEAVDNKGAKTKNFKEKVLETQSLEELHEFLKTLSFNIYKAFFARVHPELRGRVTDVSKPARLLNSKYGMPTRGQILVSASEDIITGTVEGDLISLITPDPNVIYVNKDEIKNLTKKNYSDAEMNGIKIKQTPKEAEHDIYPYAMGGKFDGLMEKFINARDMYSKIPVDGKGVSFPYLMNRGKEDLDKMSKDVLTAESRKVQTLEEDEVSQSVISAAPIRVFPEFFARTYKGRIPTPGDIKNIMGKDMFVKYRNHLLDKAQLFNLQVAKLTNNIGLYVGDLEYSNSLELKGNVTDIKAFAAYLGLSAPETQVSVAVKVVREEGRDVAYNMIFKDAKSAEQAVIDLKEQGVTGLSFDTEKQILNVFIIEEKDRQIVESYYEKHKSKIRKTQYENADIEFVGESDYESILRAYRSRESNQTKFQKDLRDAITEVLGESPDGPKGIGDVGVSRIKHTKSTRQNIIRPAKKIQEDFAKRLTPKRIGSTYAVDLEILTTIDVEELASLSSPGTGVNVGLDLLKEYNKVVEGLNAITMPGARDLEPARILANKIREALDFSTHEKITEYAYLLLAMSDADPSGITSDKDAINLIKQGIEESGDFSLNELEEDEQLEVLNFIKDNLAEIRQYASDVYISNLKSTKFSDRMSGTKYEGREALVKNDIVRSATEILLQQRDELAAAGYKKISVEQLDLTDTHMEAIAEKLGGGEDFVKILKSNRKSLTNMARNDLRNKNKVAGIVEISRRFSKRGIPQKFLRGKLFADQNVVDKILSIIKEGFTADEIKVLEDYMEYHENTKILKTMQSIQHGYMPPMAYGIINKFIQASEAIKLAGNIDNMTVMLDANGRIIKDALAAREAKELTESASEIAPEILSERTTTAAISVFDNVRDKATTKLYNLVDTSYQKVEAIREVMINNLNNKFALIKPIARFEGKQYTNMDVLTLGHMYLLEKQFLANPGNPKVPKLKENLIDSITDMTKEENRRYIELYEDFKKDNGVLDIIKTERFLREMNALNDAAKESGMAFINYYRKISKDMQFRIKFIQEFQRKTKVELFDEYVFVATKGKGTSTEAKADIIESMLRTDGKGRWTGGIAKTSISRRNYINQNKTFVKFTDREPLFDLMFSANYMINEGLSSYYVGEAYRDAVSRLNILAKMGDNETSALAQALRNDITSRIRNSVEYKLDRSKGVADAAVMKLLSGTYRAYLASLSRVVELLSNSIYVGISDPAIAKVIVKSSKDTFLSNRIADEVVKIMKKVGSVHLPRLNKVGKSFYSAEGIGNERLKNQAPSIWDGLEDKLKKKDGEYRQLYIAYRDAINRIGVISTGLKDWTDSWIRMSDTRIASIAMHTLFKNRFKELTGVDFDMAMLEDEDLFLRYRLDMKEAMSHADVFISEGFSGSSFAMNQKALKNKGTVKYIENMFRTFRTFRYETTRNAIRSLIGLRDGTMSKEEAAKKLSGVFISELMYSLGTQVAITKLFELVAFAFGKELPDDEEPEFKNWFELALSQLATTMMFGRMSAIRFGLVAGTTRAVVRSTQGDDLSTLDGFKRHLQRMKMTNYFMRQTVPILGDPTNVTLDAGISLINAMEGEAPKEDLLIDAFKMIAVYRGIPFTGDISRLYRTMKQEEKKPKKKKRKKPKFKSIID